MAEKEAKNINTALKGVLASDSTLIGLVDGNVRQIETDVDGGLMSFDNGVSKSDINVENGVTGFEPIGKIEKNNLQAINGNDTFNEIKILNDKYGAVIESVFIPEVVIEKGADINIGSGISTFASWGQLFGKLKNFNRISYIFNAYSAENIPTKVKLVLRKNSFDGEIIHEVSNDVELLHNVPKEVFFDLPEVFLNEDNSDIFISYVSNGYFLIYGKYGNTPNSENTRYSVSKDMQSLLTGISSASSELYTKLYLGSFVSHNSDNEIEYIKSKIDTEIIENPTLLLTKKTWIYPTFQYNIYSQNVLIPVYGDNNNNYRLDYNGTLGRQFSNFYRYDALNSAVNSTINLELKKGSKLIEVKSQNIIVANPNSGNGVTRKVLLIADSTGNGTITPHIRDTFANDIMSIEFIGTLGNSTSKHEGRSGWTLNDYYGIGRKLHKIPVNGITTPPGVNSIYKQILGNNFRVVEVNITDGIGYFSVIKESGAYDLETNGTLTKVSGSGDSVINYTNSTYTSSNPFYNPSTGSFDLDYYLTNTNQSISDGDWIFFQLGINDMFSYTSIVDSNAKANEMILQLKSIIENIHTYNSNIKIGIMCTFPPASQDGFGASYSLGQKSEIYIKTGLLSWQKSLINEFDNELSNSNNQYLISGHLNLDCVNNFQEKNEEVNSRNNKLVSVQNNGVHPAESGYMQLSDMYCGIIKNFG